MACASWAMYWRGEGESGWEEGRERGEGRREIEIDGYRGKGEREGG